jgi:hypothetical protein
MSSLEAIAFARQRALLDVRILAEAQKSKSRPFPPTSVPCALSVEAKLAPMGDITDVTEHKH